MTPDDTNARLARLEQRVTDLHQRVNELMHTASNVPVLSERVGTVSRTLDRLSQDFDEFCDRIDERDVEVRKERRTVKLAIWAMTVTLICSLIGAASVIITSIPHG